MLALEKKLQAISAEAAELEKALEQLFEGLRHGAFIEFSQFILAQGLAPSAPQLLSFVRAYLFF